MAKNIELLKQQACETANSLASKVSKLEDSFQSKKNFIEGLSSLNQVEEHPIASVLGASLIGCLATVMVRKNWKIIMTVATAEVLDKLGQKLLDTVLENFKQGAPNVKH